MALTVHQLALRLAKYLGVTAFDPGDVSNVNPLSNGALREGDLADVTAAINGALQEVWSLAPAAVRTTCPDGCPSVSVTDVGAVDDPGVPLKLPVDWEESVLLPLALERLSTHPDFKSASARDEIGRMADRARNLVRGLASDRLGAAMMVTAFR